MQMFKRTVAAAAVALAATGIAQAATVDTIQSPTGFFVPTDAQKTDSPYYRDESEDWAWAHNAIAGVFTTAKLLISAFDVDFSACCGLAGERDEIFAMDNGIWTSLGYLAGGDNIWAFTEFDLGSNFFDDVATGLQVRIDIDTLGEGWLVTLAKSVITTDGATPPPPPPGAVPLPAAGWMLMAGLGGIAALRRRKSA